MDIPRAQPRPKSKTLVLTVGAVLGCIGLAFGLSRVQTAAPAVERSSVWVDQVKRGPMLRQVKGPGTLVPEHIRWLTADTAGRVERIHLRPGSQVEAGTVLMELSNPDVMLQMLEAERQLADSQAALLSLKSLLENQRLAQEAVIATLLADGSDARRRAEADSALGERQLISTIEAEKSKEKALEMDSRLNLERQKLAVLKTSMAEQLAAQREQIDRLKAVAAFRKQQVESMKVKAGEDGLLQELPLELGQWVTPGVLLAKVVQPGRLKAELRIAETQARDVTRGQKAQIDTRNGVVEGTISRVAPAANQGSVLVEVSLQGELPRGARPDLNIEGTVELERLDNVLSVGRPTGAQPDSHMELFKVLPDDSAQRVRVRLGRTSVSTVEVVDGLAEGDRVILSDMSLWNDADRVRLK